MPKQQVLSEVLGRAVAGPSNAEQRQPKVAASLRLLFQHPGRVQQLLSKYNLLQELTQQAVNAQPVSNPSA